MAPRITQPPVQLIVRLNKPIIGWIWDITGRILNLPLCHRPIVRLGSVLCTRSLINEKRNWTALYSRLAPLIQGNNFNGNNFANVEPRFPFESREILISALISKKKKKKKKKPRFDTTAPIRAIVRARRAIQCWG